MIRRVLWATCLPLLTLMQPFGASAQDNLGQRARALFRPLPAVAPALQNNPATADKLQLGRMLYFEPRLSSSHLISCNTCHNLGLAGADLQETSVGHGWQRGPRNAPTVLNAVFNIAQFWDGRAEDLAEQAKGPIRASLEMNNTPERVEATLRSIPGYVKLFEKAFPDQPAPVTFDNVARAIEVFEATLLTPGGRFDRYLDGAADALASREEKGLRIFMDKGCIACHNGVNLGGAGYFPFGLVKAPDADIRPPGDPGRFTVTETAADRFVFKSPSLRNVRLTPPYFHSGRIWKLADAVAIMGSAQLGIAINAAETDALVRFLGTLNGRQPQIRYPLLPPGGDTTPRPRLTTRPPR